MKISYLVCCVVGVVLGSFVNGQEPKMDEPAGYWNVPTRTLGGQQFWTDTRHWGGWRIQKNHVTGHFRLLDANDIRQAWGNEIHCKQELERLAALQKLQPYSGKVVILLHGLNRGHKSMQPLVNYLRNAGYQTLNFQYASGRAGINDHALALQNVVEGLGKQVDEIYFAGHSLGNIVVRRYLHNVRQPESVNAGDPRIKRMVMIAPPNQGSRMARLVDGTRIFQAISGKSGVQLGNGWKQLESQLATPRFQFAIIAGGSNDQVRLNNPLLDGQGDLTVSVEETRLPGAHDTAVRPFSHTFIMQQPEAMEMTLRFFEDGYLVSEAQRTPIEKAKSR